MIRDMLTLALQELELEEAQTHYPSQALVNGIAAVKAALEAKNEPVMEYPNYTPGVGWRNVIPPQRVWAGLTNEDLANCSTDEAQWALYWEKLLKDKNT